MSYSNAVPNSKRRIIDQVLRDMPKISEAPKFVDPDHMFAEQSKVYKAVDDSGNIYEVYNPAAFPVEAGNERSCGTKRWPQKKMIMTYGEALKASGEVKSKPKSGGYEF